MNIEIARTQRCLMELYHQQRAYLAGKPRQLVEDLLHEAEDLSKSHPDFSIRTAAEINRAAAYLTLNQGKDDGQCGSHFHPVPN